jgi:serpin B
MRALKILSKTVFVALVVGACTNTADVAQTNEGGAGPDDEAGGAQATGGSDSSGGARSDTGGTSSSGGSRSTGGTHAADAGQPSSGGTDAPEQTGGRTATGGSQATGGRPPTGGSQATGGRSSTGGSQATGGSPAAAGAGGGEDIVEERSDVAPNTDPQISDADFSAFVESANRFGLELQQAATDDGQLEAEGNQVFSPLSALVALSMTYVGARGDTATAMKATLHDELDAGLYHVAQNRLMRELRSRNQTGTDHNGEELRVELAPANSIWLERTFNVQAPFLDLLSQEYDSGARKVDFVNTPDEARLAINGWVEGRTHDRIQDLLAEGDVDTLTRIVLVNALYFYANWGSLFDERSTQAEPFTTLSGDTVTVDMMHQTQQLRYGSTASYAIAQVPYYVGDLWMTVVLPADGEFETVRSQVSGDWLAEASADLVPTEVRFALPKFQIETGQIRLLEALRALGMGIAFTPEADFSGIVEGEPLAITAVIQKAFIGTDEAGTEAAAATAVIAAGGLPEDPVPLTLDRPFLYFIQDTTGIVLFSGQVVDPTL